ncbi:MAG: nicotinamidase [Deltaproteobacteria bacterium GWA2_55_10]|nr:MAG: nicotinamidase [Deltaproteobacteria bacterium GWA2_55_10]
MEKAALVVADVQNDFCPGGALQITDGDKIVPVLNRYIKLFREAGLSVFITRDWHPPKTIHFIAFGGPWPPHCVQGTKGAEFHPEFYVPKEAIIISKGDDPNTDSYSAFDGKDERGKGLADSLREKGVRRIFVGGLATDYCVKQTTLDGLKAGFEVTVLEDGVRGVDVKPGDSERAIDEMKRSGADTSTFENIEKEKGGARGGTEDTEGRAKRKAG